MTAEVDQSAKKTQPSELQNPVGWGAEWAAIQADSLAKATYDFHQSRIAALAALELGGQLEAGNIDYLEFWRLMEGARKAAEVEKLALSGEAGRATDARGFVKNFLKKEFPRGAKPERMGAEESVRQSQIAVVQTVGVILQCLEPEHELKDTSDIVNLLPAAAAALNLVGLQKVPKVTKQRQNLDQELKAYVQSQAKSRGITLPKLEGKSASGYTTLLGGILEADLLYGILINQPLVASLDTDADARGTVIGLTAQVLEGVISSDTEKGAGPRGQSVQTVNFQGRCPPWRIRILFPHYPYAENWYWLVDSFPYGKISLPTAKYDYDTLSIYRFHIQEHLPKHILTEVAGGKLESLRGLLSGPTESYRQDLAGYGLKVPDLALEQDGAKLTYKLDQLKDSLGRNEEWLNMEAMLARIIHSEWKGKKPDDLDFSPHLWQLSKSKGDIRLYAPWGRFRVRDEAEFDEWVKQHGDVAKIYFYAEAARILLPNMGTVARAEKEGRIIDVARKLKMGLKWPDKQLITAVPWLETKIEVLKNKYHGGEIPWEELVAVYQAEKPGLEAVMKSAGVDLRPRTAAEIRWAGENLMLTDAMDKQTGLRRQRLAELILLNEVDTFNYDDIPFLLRLAVYEMLSYHGELEAEEIPAEIVNVRGRNEPMFQAKEWLKSQPLEARKWLSYLMLFRMFQDTLVGRLDWPSVQAKIYQEMKEMRYAGYRIPKYSQPAVGAMIERLALVEKVGLEPKDLPTAQAKMNKIGLAVSEVKYDQWWDVYKAEAARKKYLEAMDPTDVGKSSKWLNDFAEAIKPASIKIWELLKQRYGISVS